MTISRGMMHMIGLSGLLGTALAGPATAQIGGVGSSGAPGAAGGGHLNISGAGTGLSSPDVSPGVRPLTGDAAGAPGIVAPAAPTVPSPGFAYPGVPGAAGTQPVTGVPNAATPMPLAVVPRGRPR